MIDAMIPLMSTMGIETWSVVAWLAVGVVCGIVTALFAGGKRMLLYDLIIGVVAAMAGGWGSVIALGDSTRQLFIISTLTAVFFAGAALWVFNMILMRRR